MVYLTTKVAERSTSVEEMHLRVFVQGREVPALELVSLSPFH